MINSIIWQPIPSLKEVKKTLQAPNKESIQETSKIFSKTLEEAQHQKREILDYSDLQPKRGTTELFYKAPSLKISLKQQLHDLENFKTTLTNVHKISTSQLQSKMLSAYKKSEIPFYTFSESLKIHHHDKIGNNLNIEALQRVQEINKQINTQSNLLTYKAQVVA